jgi:hypothetical protein
MSGHMLYPDRYLMANGLITGIICPRCGKVPCSGIYIIKKRENSHTLVCKFCELDRKGPRRKTPKIRPHIDEQIFRKDGFKVKVCYDCKEPKQLSEYTIVRDKRGWKGLAPYCRACKTDRSKRSLYRRLVRQAYGELSPEYAFASYEKRSGRLQAMCSLLGVCTNRGILPKTEFRSVRRVLFRMPTDSTFRGFEAAIESLEKKISQNTRRIDRVEMFTLREFQSRSRLCKTPKSSTGD